MKSSKIALTGLLVILLPVLSMAQALKDGKLTLNEDGSRYLKFTIVNQTWLRNTQFNEGSTIFGYAKKNGWDIGIRRFRMQLYGQLTDRVFIYTQLGENNFNGIQDRKFGFFVHDAIGEYALVKNKFSLGGGLTAWSGLARFASPSVGSILGVDAPLYQQSTNDVTDQFLRKLAVYAKGKLGKFDYRVVLSDPMAFQKASSYSAVISPDIANFSSKPPKFQWNGYFQWQFLDQESNLTPYMTGTYLGKKKVFNIGAGFVYQPKAMWTMAANKVDTVETNMVQLSLDAFYDAPVSEDGQAISAYASVGHFDFGKNYIRNIAAMNPTNGTTMKNVINGSGNGFPGYGTGNVIYAQVGYKLKDNLIGKTTLMPYVSLQHANYERLNQGMNYWDFGVNWLLNGHTSKLTLAYQNRPIFLTDANGKGEFSNRKGSTIIQYQVFFN
ncbi:hypothetical protein [Emticicia sp. 21SJ11W-3]|uniref:hypothetical protein n=1 Tax=Emticicia sp. 21SJ11W-3 TaxID=2916755 RepID=UPI00209C9BAD|nr:hypothetical protein [Emticicia sp. 21SJ11W-3]UTA69834.1 hypothetical protein MB380_08475 [Emticicia sp. 21SJ11W-3]